MYLNREPIYEYVNAAVSESSYTRCTILRCNFNRYVFDLRRFLYYRRWCARLPRGFRRKRNHSRLSNDTAKSFTSVERYGKASFIRLLYETRDLFPEVLPVRAERGTRGGFRAPRFVLSAATERVRCPASRLRDSPVVRDRYLLRCASNVTPNDRSLQQASRRRNTSDGAKRDYAEHTYFHHARYI